MKILKYPLTLTDRQTIEMPTNASIIHVNGQNGVPCIWAEVNPGETGSRTFYIVGTGHDIPTGRVRYIGTYHSGPFVWHIYEDT